MHLGKILEKAHFCGRSLLQICRTSESKDLEEDTNEIEVREKTAPKQSTM